LISFSQQDTAGATATRIEHIEKGLTEFTSPMDVFNPDTTKVKEFKTLAERMAHYNVPGVNIAVINSFLDCPLFCPLFSFSFSLFARQLL
jgi:hypothetical protein